ncbi:hypothetical protein, partial [Aeromonas caviae]|uniref:hypothetical protein n=1 Tax=Aeromonas caviae TaxID=648 RepID=UPI002B46EC92
LLREWHSTQPPSRVKPYFHRLFEAIDSGFALPLALSMEAHYRERIRSGNPSPAIKLQKSALF